MLAIQVHPSQTVNGNTDEQDNGDHGMTGDQRRQSGDNGKRHEGDPNTIQRTEHGLETIRPLPLRVRVDLAPCII
jgi:hypothetical protein